MLDIEYNNKIRSYSKSRQMLIEAKINKLNVVWNNILKNKISSFTNIWNQSKEEKLKAIIMTFIDKSKLRTIGTNREIYDNKSIFNMEETFNKLLNNDWLIENVPPKPD